MPGSILPLAMRANPRWRRNPDYGRNQDDRKYVRDDQHGNLVAPASALSDNIGILDANLARVLTQVDLCSACGEYMNGGPYVFARLNGDEEPPMHMPCALYAALACPHLRNARIGFCIATERVADISQDGEQEQPYFWPAGTITDYTYDEFVDLAKSRLRQK